MISPAALWGEVTEWSELIFWAAWHIFWAAWHIFWLVVVGAA